MRFLENFILEVPYLFLRRVPYLWVPIVAFWTWPPYVSGILLLLLFIGLGLMLFQGYAWEQKIKREYAVIFRDHPQATWFYRARNTLLLFMACGVLGWLFNELFDLNAIQWTVLLAGIMATYKDHTLFGRGVVYLVTDKGIAIRYVPGHFDYRLFFRYDEIRNIVPIHDVSQRDRTWSVLSPMRSAEDGLLLVPRNPDGFSKQIEKVMITPANMEAFLNYLPSGLTNAA